MIASDKYSEDRIYEMSGLHETGESSLEKTIYWLGNLKALLLTSHILGFLGFSICCHENRRIS
jgi:hypothetical protein